MGGVVSGERATGANIAMDGSKVAAFKRPRLTPRLGSGGLGLGLIPLGRGLSRGRHPARVALNEPSPSRRETLKEWLIGSFARHAASVDGADQALSKNTNRDTQKIGLLFV